MPHFTLGIYGRSLSDQQALEANRSGTVTTAQLAVVTSSRSMIGCATIGVPLMILGITTFILVGLALDKDSPFKSASIHDIIFYGSITAGMVLTLLAIAFIPHQVNRAHLRRMEEEMREGHIEQAPGRVFWDGRSYIAEMGGRRLRSLISPTQKIVMSLPPGEYRFFYLPRTKLLLSAEPLAGTHQAPDLSHGLLEVLAAVHHFRAGDLPANSEGRMTGRQKLRLALRILLPVLIAAFTVVAILSLLVVTRMTGGPSADEMIKSVGWVYALILIVALSLIFLWKSYGIILDLMAGRVKVSEGVVEKDWLASGRSSRFFYVMKGLRFNVPFRAYTALVEGLHYRIYYAPHSKVILAVEPLH